MILLLLFIFPTGHSNKDKEISFPFTLKRSGYDTVLPYFNSSYDHNYLVYKILKGYDGVIEPHATMELTTKTFGLYSGSYFTYQITCDECEDVYEGVYDAASSTTVTIPCDPYESYSLILNEYESSDSNNIVDSSEGKLLCIYVRREIRSLSKADLNSAIKAMHEIYNHTEEKGQSLYGSNYHNSTYFVNAHAFNAAWIESDHIHEGLGFFPQHVKFTNMFELAMQAVDPSVSLPYWDYSIDTAAGIKLNESFIFTPDTFGSLNSPVNPAWGFTYKYDGYDAGRIKDGLWTDLKADKNYLYPELGNPYGYLRGAWDANPSEYVTRYHSDSISLPGCKNFFSTITEQRTVQDFLYSVPYGPHATTHGAIGDVFGSDAFESLYDAGIIRNFDDIRTIASKWPIVLLKEAFRAHEIDPRKNCTVADTDCSFTCIDMAGLEESVMNMVDIYDDLTDAEMEVWMEFVCSEGYKIFAGDHLITASPSDPSFWPIHGTVEKLLHGINMVGGLTDSADFVWPTVATTTDSDASGYVCEKPKCYDPDLGDEREWWSECCRGHYEYDQLMDFITGNKSAGIGATNREILDGIDAGSNSYNMPYIYDNFEYEHCKEDGIDLPDTFWSLYLENGLDESSSFTESVDMMTYGIIVVLIIVLVASSMLYCHENKYSYNSIPEKDEEDEKSSFLVIDTPTREKLARKVTFYK